MAKRSNLRGIAAVALAIGLPASAALAEDFCLKGYGFMGSNPDGAIAKCTADLAKEEKPGAKSQILVYMAGAYAAKKDFDHALAKYDEALKLDPNNASAYFYRASFFRYERKDLDRALSNYSAAIQVDPSYPHYSARGDLYAQMDRLEAATADYDAAIRAEPRSGSTVVDVWSLDGKPHHCAVASSYGEPASAIARSADGYALTLASGKWSLRPGNGYAVEVQAQGAAQPASAKAADAITLGVPLKADKAFLAAWARTYQLKVKSANSAATVANSDSGVLSAIDECWRAVNNASATNSAPSNDPFASAP